MSPEGNGQRPGLGSWAKRISLPFSAQGLTASELWVFWVTKEEKKWRRGLWGGCQEEGLGSRHGG